MDGDIPGGNFQGGNFPGGSLMGGNFPGGDFPGGLFLEPCEVSAELISIGFSWPKFNVHFKNQG